jgi:hypothetical protein
MAARYLCEPQFPEQLRKHALDHSEFTSWSPTGMHDFHITEAFGKLIFEG